MTSRTTMALLMHVRLLQAPPEESSAFADLFRRQIPASRKYGGNLDHPNMTPENRKALREGLYHVSQADSVTISGWSTDPCLSPGCALD